MDAMAAPAHCTIVTLRSVNSILLSVLLSVVPQEEPQMPLQLADCKQQTPWCYRIGEYVDCNRMSGPNGLCKSWLEKLEQEQGMASCQAARSSNGNMILHGKLKPAGALYHYKCSYLNNNVAYSSDQRDLLCKEEGKRDSRIDMATCRHLGVKIWRICRFEFTTTLKLT